MTCVPMEKDSKDVSFRFLFLRSKILRLTLSTGPQNPPNLPSELSSPDQTFRISSALSVWWSMVFFGRVTRLGLTQRAFLHRPLLLVPRHLPKHPLISRTNHKSFFHPLLLFLACRLGPLVHSLPHPALHLGKLR